MIIARLNRPVEINMIIEVDYFGSNYERITARGVIYAVEPCTFFGVHSEHCRKMSILWLDGTSSVRPHSLAYGHYNVIG